MAPRFGSVSQGGSWRFPSPEPGYNWWRGGKEKEEKGVRGPVVFFFVGGEGPANWSLQDRVKQPRYLSWAAPFAFRGDRRFGA